MLCADLVVLQDERVVLEVFEQRFRENAALSAALGVRDEGVLGEELRRGVVPRVRNVEFVVGVAVPRVAAHDQVMHVDLGLAGCPGRSGLARLLVLFFQI